jgi:hypothetical protein
MEPTSNSSAAVYSSKTTNYCDDEGPILSLKGSIVLGECYAGLRTTAGSSGVPVATLVFYVFVLSSILAVFAQPGFMRVAVPRQVNVKRSLKCYLEALTYS